MLITEFSAKLTQEPEAGVVVDAAAEIAPYTPQHRRVPLAVSTGEGGVQQRVKEARQRGAE